MKTTDGKTGGTTGGRTGEEKQPRIAVVGGGIGGLALAGMLHRQGIAATVYERDAHPGARTQGGTLDLHPESGRRALDELGLTEAFRAEARPEGEELRILDPVHEAGLGIADRPIPRAAPSPRHRGLRPARSARCRSRAGCRGLRCGLGRGGSGAAMPGPTPACTFPGRWLPTPPDSWHRQRAGEPGACTITAWPMLSKPPGTRS
ncbi:NAD(P)-binding protein [Streptomyces mexicanus]|uniref:NAD(P)-binding protein n=1 Tax=Streptomyces mexicanus TaxID=178566 RepID=UPI00301AD62A